MYDEKMTIVITVTEEQSEAIDALYFAYRTGDEDDHKVSGDEKVARLQKKHHRYVSNCLLPHVPKGWAVLVFDYTHDGRIRATVIKEWWKEGGDDGEG